MRINVDTDLCMGHGQCELAAPDVFAVNDDAVAEVLVDQPDESRRDAVQDAVDRCPEGAISLD
jgi:ferredoxin